MSCFLSDLETVPVVLKSCFLSGLGPMLHQLYCELFLVRIGNCTSCTKDLFLVRFRAFTVPAVLWAVPCQFWTVLVVLKSCLLPGLGPVPAVPPGPRNVRLFPSSVPPDGLLRYCTSSEMF